MIHLSGSRFGSDSLTLLLMTNNDALTNNDAWTNNTLTNMTWHANWISGLLHFCFAAQLWLWLLFPELAFFFFICNQLLNKGANITVNVQILPEKPCCPTWILSQIISYPPQVIKTDCNLSPMSLLTRSGATVLGNTNLLRVIPFTAPMLAKLATLRATLWKLPPENCFIQLFWTLFTKPI